MTSILKMKQGFLSQPVKQRKYFLSWTYQWKKWHWFRSILGFLNVLYQFHGTDLHGTNLPVQISPVQISPCKSGKLVLDDCTTAFLWEKAKTFGIPRFSWEPRNHEYFFKESGKVKLTGIWDSSIINFYSLNHGFEENYSFSGFQDWRYNIGKTGRFYWELIQDDQGSSVKRKKKFLKIMYYVHCYNSLC